MSRSRWAERPGTGVGGQEGLEQESVGRKVWRQRGRISTACRGLCRGRAPDTLASHFHTCQTLCHTLSHYVCLCYKIKGSLSDYGTEDRCTGPATSVLAQGGGVETVQQPKRPAVQKASSGPPLLSTSSPQPEGSGAQVPPKGPCRAGQRRAAGGRNKPPSESIHTPTSLSLGHDPAPAAPL